MSQTEENEKAEMKMPAQQYAVHSVVRGRHNRTERAALPQKPKRKQYIGAGQLRLTHGRPVIISEAQLLASLEDFRAKQAAHCLEVRTLDGRVVDLTTLKPSAAAAPVQPKPNFPLDSVNNDKNFPGIPGHLLSRNISGDDLTVPQVLQGDDKPALFKDAAAHADYASEDDRPTNPTPPAEQDLDALVDAAQAVAVVEVDEEPAPIVREEVPSNKTQPKGSSRRKGR